jgi:hypothetical protein
MLGQIATNFAFGRSKIRLLVLKTKFSQKDNVNNSTLFVAGTEADERMSRLIGQETVELNHGNKNYTTC